MLCICDTMLQKHWYELQTAHISDEWARTHLCLQTDCFLSVPSAGCTIQKITESNIYKQCPKARFWKDFKKRTDRKVRSKM
jgi:hypothetical protein